MQTLPLLPLFLVTFTLAQWEWKLEDDNNNTGVQDSPVNVIPNNGPIEGSFDPQAAAPQSNDQSQVPSSLYPDDGQETGPSQDPAPAAAYPAATQDLALDPAASQDPPAQPAIPSTDGEANAMSGSHPLIPTVAIMLPVIIVMLI